MAMASLATAILLVSMAPAIARGAAYLAGVGVGDITGPVADVNLMGYAAPFQTAQGLHTRLYARAFMFADSAQPRRWFVYVSMDACMASQLVTLRVVQRLQAEYGSDVYGPDNVAISGTHTHASPAGFLQYLLYDITSLGFVQATFDAMVEGVLVAVRQAHGSLRPAAVSLARGELKGASINRSPTAYQANPAWERGMYETDVDTDMTLVRLEDDATGAGRGALSWFAVHCTSLNNTNRLVSGDNKAAAQLLLERWAAEVEERAAAAATAGSESNWSEEADAAAAAAADAALGINLSQVTGCGAAGGATAAVGPVSGGGGVCGSGGAPAGVPFHLRLHRHPDASGGADVASSNGGSGRTGRISAAGGAATGAVGEEGRGSGAAGQGGDPGLGSLRFEPGFVAAVAQASVGDTSPNTAGAFCIDTGLPCDAATSTCNGRNEMCHGRGPSWPDDRNSATVIGARQFDAARRLYGHASLPLTGPLDYRSTYLDMTNITVQPAPWNGYRGGTTCPPAMGMSFAAGTTDGPGAFDFRQGDTRGPPLWRLVRSLVLPPSAQQQACQAPKPILLDTGQITVPYLWQPRVTQISLLRLGHLIIACVPGEFTTMAGRRLKRILQQRFEAAAAATASVGTSSSRVRSRRAGGKARDGGGGGSGEGGDERRPVVVISGLTGTYSSYITTWEEYQVQRYEGASTLYGPFTLDAYIQEFLRLADAMIEGRPVTSAVEPPDLQSHQLSLLAPVVVDWVPPGSHFGQVTQQVASKYRPGDTAQATFRAANPRNNLRTNRTFMAVELFIPRSTKSTTRPYKERRLAAVAGAAAAITAATTEAATAATAPLTKPAATATISAEVPDAASSAAVAAAGVGAGSDIDASSGAIRGDGAGGAHDISDGDNVGDGGGAAASAAVAAAAADAERRATAVAVLLSAIASAPNPDTAAALLQQLVRLQYGGQQQLQPQRWEGERQGRQGRPDGHPENPARQGGAGDGPELHMAAHEAAAQAGGEAGAAVAEAGQLQGPPTVPCAAAEMVGDVYGEWQVVYDDRDWVTRFHWHRPYKLSPESFATLLWDIPPAIPLGTYRLRYFGDARSLSGRVRPFEGCSEPFSVVGSVVGSVEGDLERGREEGHEQDQEREEEQHVAAR